VSSALSPFQKIETMDEERLATVLVQHGGQVPPAHLGAVSARIEQFTREAAPRAMAQKRVFVTDWMVKHAPAAAPSSAAASSDNRRPPRPPTPEPETPPPRSGGRPPAVMAVAAPETAPIAAHRPDAVAVGTPKNATPSSSRSSRLSTPSRHSATPPPRGLSADEFDLAVEIASYRGEGGAAAPTDAATIPTQVWLFLVDVAA